MPVVGRGGAQRRPAELAVVGDPEIGDPPALRVHGAEDVVLDQRRQAEVLRRERPVGVVAGHGTGVVRGASGVEVDSHEDIRPGLVRADVPGGYVVVHALHREETTGDVAGQRADHRLGLGSRHDHGETLRPEELHRVELDRESLVGLVDRLARLGLAYAPRVDAAVAGVEEDSQMAVARRRLVLDARAGLEVARVDGARGGDASCRRGRKH